MLRSKLTQRPEPRRSHPLLRGLRRIASLLAIAGLSLGAQANKVALPPLVIPPALPAVGAPASLARSATPPVPPQSSLKARLKDNAGTAGADCLIRLGPSQAQVELTEGQDGVIQFTPERGARCLTAALSEANWLEARLDASQNRIYLMPGENREKSSRATWVSVVAGHRSFRVRVVQAGTPAMPVEAASPPGQADLALPSADVGVQGAQGARPLDPAE